MTKLTKLGAAIVGIILGFAVGAVAGNAILAPVRFDVVAVSAFGSVLAGLATSVLAVLGFLGYRSSQGVRS